MEEKILETLYQMQNQLNEMNGRLNGMNSRLDQMDNRLDKMDNRLDQMDNRLDQMDQKIDKVKTELNQSMDDLRKEILDRQFVFEDEYGKKIDAIFDYVQFHQDNNLKRFDKISDLEKRVEIVEVHNLNHEKRISILERKRD